MRTEFMGSFLQIKGTIHMNYRRHAIAIPLILLTALGWVWAQSPAPATATAGLAKVDITPRVPVRMCGYASRLLEGEPAEGRLFARALALGDAEGKVAALAITADLLGIPKSLADRVFERVHERFGLPREALMISATHTHGGPSLTDFMQELHFCAPLLEEEKAHIDEYTNWLVDQLETVAVDAVEARLPATLSWGEGKATFGMNRRTIRDGQWVSMKPNPDGPVDHALPVLMVRRSSDNSVLGTFLSYACHCTSFNPPRQDFHGDWAGAAAAEIERRHPGAVALLAAGCGGDINPDPRTADAGPFVEAHGRKIADQVDALLTGKTETTAVASIPVCDLKVIRVPLAFVPDRDHLVGWTQLGKKDPRRAFYGQVWLDRLDRGMTVPKDFEYPVQTWRFDGIDNQPGVTAVFLAGEVVVEYGLRLKRELDSAQQRHWVMAYANDAPGYIVTRLQAAEGGYEPVNSNISYDKTSRMAPEAEDIIINAAKDLAGGGE